MNSLHTHKQVLTSCLHLTGHMQKDLSSFHGEDLRSQLSSLEKPAGILTDEEMDAVLQCSVVIVAVLKKSRDGSRNAVVTASLFASHMTASYCQKYPQLLNSTSYQGSQKSGMVGLDLILSFSGVNHN